MSILDKAVSVGNKVLKVVKHNGPTIMLFTGSAAVIIGGFLACKETLKAEEIVDEHRAKLAMIEEATADTENEYTESDRKKDLIQVYSSTAGKFVRLYAPAAILEIAGFAAIFGGFGLIKKRYGIALGTIASLDDKLARLNDKYVNYRSNVINKYGEDADLEMAETDTEGTDVDVTVKNEDGEEETKSKKAVNLKNITNHDFVRYFDAMNDKWQGDPVLDENFLNQVEQWYTLQLQSHRIDHVFMNMIDKELAFDETGIGHFYGWTDKPGCSVDFHKKPYIRVFDGENDDQFPMIVLVESEEDYADFKQLTAEDAEHNMNVYDDADKWNRTGYLLVYNVDCDENNMPREIYHDVFDK